MRAVVIKDHERNPDSAGIVEVDDPVPGEGEVVVDVKACGINYTDYLSLGGGYQNNPPPPFTPGKDAAGVVAAVGGGVTRHKVGDRVLAHLNHGAMAEKIACHEALACEMPDGVGFDDAAALGLAHLTAYVALVTRGQLSADDVVLVNGASGGVGLASVGLAKALGAKTVLGGVTTMAKADAVTAAGADAIIDLAADNLRDSLREQATAATGGHGVDLAVDLVGGEVFDATLRAVADAGRVVVTGFTSGTIPSVRTNYLLLKNISVVGMTVAAYMKTRSPEIARAQAAIFDLVAAGKIRPNITERLPFERFMDGIRLIEDRKIVGKAVLVI